MILYAQIDNRAEREAKSNSSILQEIPAAGYFWIILALFGELQSKRMTYPRTLHKVNIGAYSIGHA